MIAQGRLPAAGTDPDAPLGHDHPINRLRRLAALLAYAAAADTCPAELAADAKWLAAALHRFEAGAPDVDLAQAFDLARRPGRTPWYEAEALWRRDELIREVRSTFFADLDADAAAKAIAQAAGRCANAKRRPDSGAGALLSDAARIKPVPKTAKRIREVLGMK